MFKIKNLSLVLTLFLTLFSLGCSKENHVSKVSISFDSKLTSSSASSIETIIINVSAPNLPFIFAEKDCDQQDCSFISVEVPSGENRLIQLLVITKNTSGEKINYGDVTANLTSGNVSLGINLTERASFNSEARLSGRYIPTANHELSGQYLTGNVIMSVAVGNGKPDMKIKSFEIFGGWFEAFVLDTVGFKFNFTGWNELGQSINNRPILNDLHDANGLVISSAGLAANTNKIVHFSSPNNFYEEKNGQWELRPFRNKIVGLFGQYIGGEKFCAENFLSTTLFDGSSGMSRLCKSLNGSICDNHMRWSDITSSSASLSGSTNSCTNVGNEYKVDLKKIGEDHGELAGFNGPFIKKPLHGINDLMQLDPTNSTLNWSIDDKVYLPAGVEIFIRTLGTPFNSDQVRHHDEGINCSLLPQFGFSSLGIISSSSTSSISLPTAVTTNSNAKIALCPKKQTGGYYRSALMSEGNNSFQPKIVELKLYDSALQPVSGWSFNDPNWNSPNKYLMDPTQPNSAIDMFVEIKNITAQPINIQNYNINGSFPDFSTMDTGYTPPVGTTLCSVARPFSLNSGASCVTRIIFGATTTSYPTPGVSVHNAFSLQAQSSSGSVYYKGFKFVAATIQTVNYLDSSFNTGLFAPPGNIDYKYLLLNNNSGGAWLMSAIPAPGVYGNLVFDTSNCGTSIANGGTCIIKVTFNNFDGSQFDGSYTPVSFSPTPTNGTFNITVTPPTSNGGNPYDFNTVTSATSHTFTITNNTGFPMNTKTATITGTNYTISANSCSNTSISSVATCSFDINAGFPGVSSGTIREHFVLPYSIEESYRQISFEVEAKY